MRKLTMYIAITLISLLLMMLLFLGYSVGILELFNSKEVYKQNKDIQYKSIDIDGLKTHYLVLGDPDQPTILFLHGWAGNYKQEPIRQILTAFNEYGYRVIAVEMPGMGRSQTPHIPWSNEMYADFTKSFMDKLDLKTVILIGQSFGGSVATRFATKYPLNVSQLVFVNAASHDKSAYKKWLVKTWGSAYPTIIDSRLFSQSFKHKITKFMLRLPDDVLSEQNMQERANIMGKTFMLTHSEDLLNLLPDIKNKTLVVWGKSDTKIPLREARKIVEQLADGKLLVLEGGHTVIFDRPKAVIDLIVENLQK